jgi:hypothetical protein
VLLGAGAFLDATLISREQFAALAGFRIRRPDGDGQAAEIDAGDLGRIKLVIGQVTLADLPGPMALEDDHLPADGSQPFGHGEGIGAGLDEQHVFGGGVASCPGAERLQRLAGDAVGHAGLERVAPAQDGGGKGIGVDVQPNRAALWAEGRLPSRRSGREGAGIGGLLWRWLGHRMVLL